VASLALGATLDSTRQRRIGDFLVAVAWTLPQVALLVVLGYRLSGAEGYYFLLSFPHSQELIWAQAGVALAPVALTLLAAPRIRGARPLTLLVFLVTYPLMLFVDIYAGVLGTVDLVLGRSSWTPIERRNVVGVTSVPETVRKRLSRATLTRARFRALLWIPVAGGFVAAANELLSVDECGEVKAPLWKPLLRGPSHPVRLVFDTRKTLGGDAKLALELQARVSGELPPGARLTFTLDGRPLETRPLSASAGERRTVDLPLGFERHTAGVSLSGRELACRRSRQVSTALTELRDGQLYLNGEPLVIKGVVDSFSSPQVGLSPAAGLAQLKAMGANAVRAYHRPTRAFLDAASQTGTLVIDQPNESTWLNIDVLLDSDRRKLLERYRELVEETEGHPFILIDNLGNELDMRPGMQMQAMQAMRRALADAREEGARFLLGFSTYSTFADYPVDVLGVNMLDTSETYWTGALDLLTRLKRPFYASELGGFVAFSERPPTAVRIERLRRYWKRLLDAHALGACVFESHDNWAQAVQPGPTTIPSRRSSRMTCAGSGTTRIAPSRSCARSSSCSPIWWRAWKRSVWSGAAPCTSSCATGARMRWPACGSINRRSRSGPSRPARHAPSSSRSRSCRRARVPA
jgi:hypothetical protein